MKAFSPGRKFALSAIICLAVSLSAMAPNAAHGASTPTRAAAAHSQLWSQFLSQLKGKYNGKTLHIIMINDPFLGAYTKMTDAFKALTGANVSIDSYAYDATYQKEVLAGDQKSGTYDIDVFDIPWTQKFVPYVDPLDSYIAKENPALIQYNDFFPVMRQASSWSGKVVGFPFAPYFVLQHYNTKVYQTLGLKPATTIDQFIHNAQVSTKNAKAPSVYGTAMNNQAGSAVGQAFFEYIYNFAGGKPFASMYPGSAKPYSDMTPKFASTQGLQVVNMLKTLLPSEPPGALNIAWTNRQSYFNTARVAAVNQWDVTTPSASDPSQSTVANSYATAPFPHNSKLVTQVGGWTMGINKYGSQKSLAWDFIKWFTSSETSVQFALAGGFPARTLSLSDPRLVSKYPWYATLRQVIPTAFADCRPRIAQSFDIINTLGTYISKALSGTLTPKQAMLDADHDIGLSLRKAGYTVKSLTD